MACDRCKGNFIIVSGKHGGYVGCKNSLRNKTCANKRNILYQNVEATLIGVLKNFIDNPKSLKYLTKKYNETIQAKLSLIPNKITQKEKELQRVERAIQSFIKFLAEGNPSEAVSEGLKRSEEEKKRILTELKNLKAQEPKKILLTPFAIKQKLLNLDGILKQDIAKANACLKAIFPELIQMQPLEKQGDFSYEAVGAVNLGKLFRYATPVNGAPHLLEEVPILKKFRVRIK